MLLLLIPILCLIPFILTAFVLIHQKKKSLLKRKSPLARELLRSPGESLRSELEEIESDLGFYLVILPTIPLLLYSYYLTSILYRGVTPNIWLQAMYVFIGLSVLTYFAFKLTKLANRKSRLALGYEAELAVAQELHQLAHEGFWIFHDVPADGFNIDHVAVGPHGIFAIETKGRSKPLKDGKSEWTVKYDGATLSFPGWQDTTSVAQAQRQGRWLQQWLSSAVGESLQVIPALALPGWFIERTAKGGITVFTGKSAFQILCQRLQPCLSEKQIKQICHQLDQRCRDVKPTGFRPTP